MVKNTGEWERIWAVILRANMTTNYFAKYIGLPCGENLYRIKRGNNGISRDVAERIVSKFPEISKGWLLTGEGNMLRDENQRSSEVPFLKGRMHDVLSDPENAESPYSFFLPNVDNCDFAVKYTPESGSYANEEITLLLQERVREQLVPGKIYVFVNRDRSILRKWDRSEQSHAVSALADRIFLIRGQLTINK